jgi:acyl dehydratase
MYLEDFTVGEVETFGSYRVTREEVIEFASRYDPQPFHLNDDAAAENRIFGRLAASGWHTAAMTMRMRVDHAGGDGAFSLGSPGIDELRWLRPVYPGDTLSVRTEVLEINPSRSRPDMGSVRGVTSTLNQHGEEVMRMMDIGLYPRRPQEG